MKKIIYIAIGIIGGLLVFFGCKQDDPVPAVNPTPYHLQQATKDYCLFKPGSWWLYQDSVTGIKDSVYVVAWGNNYDTITEQDNLGYTGIFETFFVLTHSTYLDYTQKVYYHSAFSQWSHRDDTKYYRYNSSYTGGEESYFTTNFQNGFTFGAAPGTVTSLGYYDSLKVGTIFYKNVSPFYNSNNNCEYDMKTYMYMSKNIGLVKKSIPDSSQNWILLNYNIIQ